MGAQQTSISAADIAAAIDWWKLAGLEVDAVDEPSGWLGKETGKPVADATAEPPPKAAPKPAKPPAPSPHAALPGLPAIGSDAASWPQELAQFQRWWAEDENFAAQGAFPRISPRGPARAKLMILVPHPEEADTDSLLSGPHGAFLGGFLRAAGLAEDAVYFASVLPRHTLRPDWKEVGTAGYGALAAHHIHLTAPETLLVFGPDILPLLPHEPAQGSDYLRSFNHESPSIPLLPARDVANLAHRPAFRARFWKHWLEFSERGFLDG